MSGLECCVDVVSDGKDPVSARLCVRVVLRRRKSAGCCASGLSKEPDVSTGHLARKSLQMEFGEHGGSSREDQNDAKQIL